MMEFVDEADFVVADAEGRIVRWGRCRIAHVPLQAAPGLTVHQIDLSDVEAAKLDRTHVVENGALRLNAPA